MHRIIVSFTYYCAAILDIIGTLAFQKIKIITTTFEVTNILIFKKTGYK